MSVSCQRNADTINLDQQIQQLHDKGLFNGAIIVTNGNEIILSRGFGYANFEAQVPFKTNTSMDTGSITKTFTALAMMILADSKEIDLNTPVSSFIQEFPYGSITIRHLLEQTSGIVSDDYVFERAQKGIPITNSTFLDFLVEDKPSLEYTPGSEYMYNGYNYRLLAILIETISEDSYEDFIRVNMAEPLDLNNWFLRPASLMNLPNDRAFGYSKTADTLLAFGSEDFEGFYGDCNLFFSAEDLSKWSKSFILNSIYPVDKLNLALKTKSKLSEFNILHWYKLTNQEKYHFTGDWKGFYAMVYYDKDKNRSIVYLTNTNMPHWLRPALVRNINHFLDNGQFHNWNYPQSLELSNREIIGDYQLRNEQNFHIFENDSSLKLNTNSKTVSLFKLSSNIYYAPAIDQWVWFARDDKRNLKIYSSSIYELNEGVKNSSQQRL
ncbi:serine hydrolase domain-containing protein [Muriicola sp. Z0-33]|uniref:serine hydrolase domain-containing protein n=1 Tax=Muriicola sp. Z0-33 TaxID=2816957 RepID=UPI002237AA09|nr:serine hydrolase domain-containing protein [Muriicola sp. Z0-33]MCW5518159.1 beta-lactamase family protein [Muriicola sp. Z0-33]